MSGYRTLILLRGWEVLDGEDEKKMVLKGGGEKVVGKGRAKLGVERFSERFWFFFSFGFRGGFQVCFQQNFKKSKFLGVGFLECGIL